MNDETPSTEDELTRLADGSASDAEREALRTRVDGSAELGARLDEQARAIALVHAAADDVTAPASLRASVREMTGGRPATRRRRALYMPVATALAVVIAAIVLAVQGSSTTPTVRQTARLALSAAILPAPGPDLANHELLDVRVGNIPFPSYVPSVGWQATGARRDRLHGRPVTTVFYRAADGTRVGYAIVSGHALADPRGPSETVAGVRYVFGGVGSARLVTWRRDGHTCVIAGRSVGDATLLALAGADERTGR